jgi:hypothetical protein
MGRWAGVVDATRRNVTRSRSARRARRRTNAVRASVVVMVRLAMFVAGVGSNRRSSAEQRRFLGFRAVSPSGSQCPVRNFYLQRCFLDIPSFYLGGRLLLGTTIRNAGRIVRPRNAWSRRTHRRHRFVVSMMCWRVSNADDTSSRFGASQAPLRHIHSIRIGFSQRRSVPSAHVCGSH